ncbi:putative S-adenosyl-L-methionine-dependent methyltransferase [Medicago truncatula]|uniref:Methyltransferase n=1 Tax=Medicago truncatula TaxID=3880 RepID=A0A396HP26_MEDTR|nr:putative S-adenosyl-L-methionine-dependent methyltransferase [Medicago truncatula]
MALFKTRNSRRSSSPSYVSTLVTLGFIALCVFGVWMLNSNSSNSMFSSKTQSEEEITSTRTAIDTSDNTNNDFSTSDDSQQTKTKNTEELVQTTTVVPKIEEQKETPTAVYGDNPGHLPDDAIKSDDKNLNNDQNKQQSVVSDSQISEESSLTQKEQVSAIHESKSDNDGKVSESEKVQQSNIESSGENKKEEQDNTKSQDVTESNDVNVAENQEQSTVQQQDVPTFDTQGSKNDEDEANKEQLREDKGEIEEQQNSKLSKTASEKNEGEETVKPKAEKKGGKSKKPWSTQADQSQNEKKRQKGDESGGNEKKLQDNKWSLCNVTAGADYIPCLDNEKAIKKLRSTKHFEHRERHCPEEGPTCLVPLPNGYKTSIKWPNSRDKVWYHNVPHTSLAEVKGHQNWVKVSGEFLTFPGGGTQFIHGALHYIDFLQQAEPDIAWGKRTRVILDVGCGVGSFGGYLFDRDVVAMSLAPKDEHEAQVQFALERGIPAISAVMGSQRLPFPNGVFDLIHCARCRVPWHEEGGKLLLELNRVLRPGGYFAWSATPVYQKLEEDVEIWKGRTTYHISIVYMLLRR